MPSLRRLVKLVAFGMGLLVVLVLLVVAATFAYAELKSNEEAVLPEPTGPYAVGRVSYDWVDPSREEVFTRKKDDRRELMAFVWYPAEKSASDTGPAAYLPGKWGQERQKEFGPWSFLAQRLGSVRTHSYEGAPVSEAEDRYPVLVMEPGFGPLPTDYTTLAENLASHGYVVVASAPTYSASVVVFEDGRVAKTLPSASFPESENAPVTEASIRADEAAGARLVGVWVKDMSFELDQMARLDAEPNGRFYGRLDTDRVGMFGHSLGGATAMRACASEARCRAAVNLDGSPYGAGDLIRDGSPRPVMYVASDLPGSACDRECEEGDRWMREIYERSVHGAYYLTIEGTRHFDFTDYAVLFSPVLRMRGLLGPIDGRRALSITNAYLLDFFDRYLKSTDAPLLRGPSSGYSEVRFESR